MKSWPLLFYSAHVGAAAGIHVQTNNTGGNCFCSCDVTHSYLFWVCRSGAAWLQPGMDQSCWEKRTVKGIIFCPPYYQYLNVRASHVCFECATGTQKQGQLQRVLKVTAHLTSMWTEWHDCKIHTSHSVTIFTHSSLPGEMTHITQHYHN